MERSAVLIDLGFFAKILKYCFDEPRIDFERFSDIVTEGTERFRTYVYDCLPYRDEHPSAEQQARYENHQRFLNAIRRLNRFDVRLGRLAYDSTTGEYVQKRVDVLMSVDLVRMSWSQQIRTAVLVTGDSDLVPAVQAAKYAGVVTILYYASCYDEDERIRTRAHDELLTACDESHLVTREIIEQSMF